jgi:hypothetical protein
VAFTDITTENRHRWRIVATVAGVINLLLAVIDIGLAAGSGIPAVYTITVVLLANAVICFAFARYLR